MLDGKRIKITNPNPNAAAPFEGLVLETGYDTTGIAFDVLMLLDDGTTVHATIPTGTLLEFVDPLAVVPALDDEHPPSATDGVHIRVTVAVDSGGVRTRLAAREYLDTRMGSIPRLRASLPAALPRAIRQVRATLRGRKQVDVDELVGAYNDLQALFVGSLNPAVPPALSRMYDAVSVLHSSGRSPNLPGTPPVSGPWGGTS